MLLSRWWGRLSSFLGGGGGLSGLSMGGGEGVFSGFPGMEGVSERSGGGLHSFLGVGGVAQLFGRVCV